MTHFSGWYEDRFNEVKELDELSKLYQEQELFKSMNRLGLVREKGDEDEDIPLDNNSPGAIS